MAKTRDQVKKNGAVGGKGPSGRAPSKISYLDEEAGEGDSESEWSSSEHEGDEPRAEQEEVAQDAESSDDDDFVATQPQRSRLTRKSALSPSSSSSQGSQGASRPAKPAPRGKAASTPKAAPAPKAPPVAPPSAKKRQSEATLTPGPSVKRLKTDPDEGPSSAPLARGQGPPELDELLDWCTAVAPRFAQGSEALLQALELTSHSLLPSEIRNPQSYVRQTILPAYENLISNLTIWKESLGGIFPQVSGLEAGQSAQGKPREPKAEAVKKVKLTWPQQVDALLMAKTRLSPLEQRQVVGKVGHVIITTLLKPFVARFSYYLSQTSRKLTKKSGPALAASRFPQLIAESCFTPAERSRIYSLAGQLLSLFDPEISFGSGIGKDVLTDVVKKLLDLPADEDKVLLLLDQEIYSEDASELLARPRWTWFLQDPVRFLRTLHLSLQRSVNLFVVPSMATAEQDTFKNYFFIKDGELHCQKAGEYKPNKALTELEFVQGNQPIFYHEEVPGHGVKSARVYVPPKEADLPSLLSKDCTPGLAQPRRECLGPGGQPLLDDEEARRVLSELFHESPAIFSKAFGEAPAPKALAQPNPAPSTPRSPASSVPRSAAPSIPRSPAQSQPAPVPEEPKRPAPEAKKPAAPATAKALPPKVPQAPAKKATVPDPAAPRTLKSLPLSTDPAKKTTGGGASHPDPARKPGENPPKKQQAAPIAVESDHDGELGIDDFDDGP